MLRSKLVIVWIAMGLCSGVFAAAPFVARAQTPGQICQDAVSHDGRKFMDRTLKAASACEKSKAEGKLGASISCRSGLVDIIPLEYADPSFNAKVFAARGTFTDKLLAACPLGAAAAAGIGTPCSLIDGIVITEDLAGCLIYDGTGYVSSRIQGILFVAIPGAGVRECRAEVAKSVAKLTKRRLVNARTCGKAAMRGKTCDVAKLDAKLSRLSDKVRPTVLARCPESLPLHAFGGMCAQTFASWEATYACIAEAVRIEADRVVEMTYPGMGF